MKRTLKAVPVLLAALFLSACGNAVTQETAIPSAAEPSMPIETEIRLTENEAVPDEAENEVSDIDVDLTQLSSTMVYGEVFAMLTEPESYIGKTVKMNGQFAVGEYAEKMYFFCIVQDATACCAQGLEFVLAGEPVYPEDYPEQGAEITVVGVFDTYWETENGEENMYVTLRDASFV